MPDDVARFRHWPAAFAAGVIATALSWGAGEAALDFFPQKRLINPQTETVDMALYNRVVVKNATLAYGLQGAILGLTLGLAGAATRRSAGHAVRAGLTGLLAGGAVGAVASFGLFTAFASARSSDISLSLMAHGGVWSLIGACGGAAFGLGLGGHGWVGRAALGGLIGAALGAVVYEFAGGILLPQDRTGEPQAASCLARLLGYALVNVFAALGAVIVPAMTTRPRSGA
jgi:hypothetical protein